MGPTNSSVNNQVAKLEVGGVVAVNPMQRTIVIVNNYMAPPLP